MNRFTVAISVISFICNLKLCSYIIEIDYNISSFLLEVRVVPEPEEDSVLEPLHLQPLQQPPQNHHLKNTITIMKMKKIKRTSP